MQMAFIRATDFAFHPDCQASPVELNGCAGFNADGARETGIESPAVTTEAARDTATDARGRGLRETVVLIRQHRRKHREKAIARHNPNVIILPHLIFG